MITAVITPAARTATTWTLSGAQHTVAFPVGRASAAHLDAVAQVAAGGPHATAVGPAVWHLGGSTVTVALPAGHEHLDVADAAVPAVAQFAAPQDAPAMAPASVGATGVTNGMAALILGGLIWYAVKHKNHKWGWMVVGIAMGTFIGAGSIGQMIHNTVGQLLASAINSLGGMA